MNPTAATCFPIRFLETAHMSQYLQGTWTKMLTSVGDVARQSKYLARLALIFAA
jgi:hypothetical protein